MPGTLVANSVVGDIDEDVNTTFGVVVSNSVDVLSVGSIVVVDVEVIIGVLGVEVVVDVVCRVVVCEMLVDARMYGTKIIFFC